MLSREAAGPGQRPRKIDVQYWPVPHREVSPVVKYRMIPLLSSCYFARTPSAVIQRGGRVGLSSVPHGKLVTYNSYI